jgi:Zn-dependent protease with chaperone function
VIAAALSLLVSAAVRAAPPSCAEALRARVAAVRAASFPGLAGADLRVEFFDDPVDRARATVRFSPRSPGLRAYVVELNRSLCADAPPPRALDAVLAHELSHLADYRGRSVASLVSLGLTYLLAPAGARVTAYERATDEAAVRAGYAEGLKEYRLWLYPRLTPAQAALKRRQYLTPEELDARLDARR